MVSFTSTLIIFIGVVIILLSLLQRWVLIVWYRDMSESSWFSWGWAVPYIDHRDGRAEFAKTTSNVFLVEGTIHVVTGAILLPFPDFPLLLGVWIFLVFAITWVQRGAFIKVAMKINRKYARLPVIPTKACPVCGGEMRLDLKFCPRCGELLRDQCGEIKSARA